MNTPSIDELAKAAVASEGSDLVKALYAGAEAEAIAHRMLTDSRYGPTYESMKPQHSKMWKAADLILSLSGRVEALEGGFERGLEAAAKLIKKRRDDYHEEHAIYDYETGATEYPGNGLDFMSEWEELEEAIHVLSTPKPEGEK